MLMLHKQFAYDRICKSIERHISACLDLFGVGSKQDSGYCSASDEDKQEISVSSIFGLAPQFTSNAPHGAWS